MLHNTKTTPKTSVSFRPMLAVSARINDWSEQYYSIGPDNPKMDTRALIHLPLNRRISYLHALKSNSSECTQCVAGNINSKTDTSAASRLNAHYAPRFSNSPSTTVASVNTGLSQNRCTATRPILLLCLLLLYSSNTSISNPEASD